MVIKITLIILPTFTRGMVEGGSKFLCAVKGMKMLSTLNLITHFFRLWFNKMLNEVDSSKRWHAHALGVRNFFERA